MIKELKPNLKILIVDDDINCLNLLLELFKNYPFSTLVAISGESALEKALAVTPDLILLDIMLSGIDGFETLRRLKAESSLSDIPVIFMTALSGTADKIKGFEAGCVDYVTKPFQNEEVLARVNAHLIIREQTQILEKMNHVLARKNKIIQSNLDMAKKIQLGLMPKQMQDRAMFKVRSIYQPADELGGDFYDLHFRHKKELKFYISDVSGHGVSSALIATLQKPLIDGYFQGESSPGETLTRMNNVVHKYLEGEGYFFTAIYGCIDFEKMTMEYSNAAHPDIIVVRKDKTVTELKPPKKDFLIGPFQAIEYHTHSEKIYPGDIIVLYTDGIIEAINTNNELYGTEKLYSVLAESYSKGAQGMIDSVTHSLNIYTDSVIRDDDVTFLAIEIQGGQ